MVGWSRAEQNVVGQGLVQDGASRAGEGRAPPVAAHTLIGQRSVQRPPWRQVPVERKLGVIKTGNVDSVKI